MERWRLVVGRLSVLELDQRDGARRYLFQDLQAVPPFTVYKGEHLCASRHNLRARCMVSRNTCQWGQFAWLPHGRKPRGRGAVTPVGTFLPGFGMHQLDEIVTGTQPKDESISAAEESR